MVVCTFHCSVFHVSQRPLTPLRGKNTKEEACNTVEFHAFSLFFLCGIISILKAQVLLFFYRDIILQQIHQKRQNIMAL